MGNLLVDVLLPWRMLAMLLHFISAVYVISWLPDSAQVSKGDKASNKDLFLYAEVSTYVNQVTVVPSSIKDEAFQFWRNYVA
jgi:hypothetical protein